VFCQFCDFFRCLNVASYLSKSNVPQNAVEVEYAERFRGAALIDW